MVDGSFKPQQHNNKTSKVLYKVRNVGQCGRIEDQEIDQYTYSLTKLLNMYMVGEQEIPQQMMLRKLNIHK